MGDRLGRRGPGFLGNRGRTPEKDHGARKTHRHAGSSACLSSVSLGRPCPHRPAGLWLVAPLDWKYAAINTPSGQQGGGCSVHFFSGLFVTESTI